MGNIVDKSTDRRPIDRKGKQQGKANERATYWTSQLTGGQQLENATKKTSSISDKPIDRVPNRWQRQ
jgi:hypothetical protein